MNGIGHLERHLATADILHAWGNPYSGACPSYVLLLDGSVLAYCKPQDEGNSCAQCVRNEVAAWCLAKQLGWTSLLPATAPRVITSFKDGTTPVLSSVQVAWKDPDRVPPLAGFSDPEVWRAATFDALNSTTDRSGNNWLGVRPDGGDPRLVLVDHSYAFGHPNPGLSSEIYQLKAGQRLPDEIKEGLERFLHDGPTPELAMLLPPVDFTALVARIEHMVGSGTLAVP